MNLINFPQKSNLHIYLKYLGNQNEYLSRLTVSFSSSFFVWQMPLSLESIACKAQLKNDRGMWSEGPIYSIK